jgi:hypothetical protein
MVLSIMPGDSLTSSRNSTTNIVGERVLMCVSVATYALFY